MGSLSNLYISQSFQSLIHLGNDTSASATQIELQDGVGQGLGVYVNTEGDVSIDGALIVSGTFDIEGRIVVNDDVRINGNLAVSGATSLTGSLAVTQDITASNISIQSDLNVGGTLYANKVVTLIESSSIIYSSGSNILGDEVSDTQTLIGSVIMSGSGALTGSMGISGDLEVKGNISSSTISGIGNVTAYSQSVDARLDYLEGPFSTSVDARLDVVEATASLYVPFSQSVDARLDVVEATASLYVPFSTSVDSRLDIVEATASLYVPFSTSVDARLDALEAFTGSEGLLTTASFNVYTASIRTELNTIEVATASLNAFTQSADSRLNNLEAATASYATSASVALTISNLSSSIEITDSAQTQRINVLSSFTGSYATTGSNTFIGTESITGSLNITGSMGIRGNMIYSGSVRGVTIPLTITSQTASMDCSLGNFFTLTLVSGSATNLQATNIQPGQTISLRVTQPVGSYGSVTTNGGTIRFPQTSPYIATPSGSAVDVISFLSFDTSVLYGAAVNTMR